MCIRDRTKPSSELRVEYIRKGPKGKVSSSPNAVPTTRADINRSATVRRTRRPEAESIRKKISAATLGGTHPLPQEAGVSRVHHASVSYETKDEIAVVTIDRAEVRNAVDRDAAEALASAFRNFDADPDLKVAILTGACLLY